MNIEQFVFNLQEGVETCVGFTDDLKTMAQWWELWAQPKELIQTLELNLVHNRKEIMRSISDEQDDLNDGNYFQAGNDLADICVEFMGPAPHRHPDSIIIDDNKITNAVIAKIISGFAFGMVG